MSFLELQSFLYVFSLSLFCSEEEEYEEEVGDGEGEKGEDFEMEREKFLSRVRERQSMDPFGMIMASEQNWFFTIF